MALLLPAGGGALARNQDARRLHSLAGNCTQTLRSNGTRVERNRLRDRQRAQARSAATMRVTKPLSAAGSSQRITATMPLAGSIQVTLPPAPMAKKLCGEAAGWRAPPVLSHQRKP